MRIATLKTSPLGHSIPGQDIHFLMGLLSYRGCVLGCHLILSFAKEHQQHVKRIGLHKLPKLTRTIDLNDCVE